MTRQSAIHQLLGTAFDGLPAALRRAHDHPGRITLSGEAEVEVFGGILGRLICWSYGLPRAGRQPVSVTFVMEEGRPDRWIRDFDHRRYASDFSVGTGRDAGRLVERMGPTKVTFALATEPGRLTLRLIDFALLGIPFRGWLAPGCIAYEEEQDDGAMVFDILLTFPMLGRLIAYRGVIR